MKLNRRIICGLMAALLFIMTLPTMALAMEIIVELPETPETFRVEFVADGDIVGKPMNVLDGSSIAKYAPKAPKLEGFAFVEWLSDSDSTLDKIIMDTVFTAVYEPATQPEAQQPAEEEETLPEAVEEPAAEAEEESEPAAKEEPVVEEIPVPQPEEEEAVASAEEEEAAPTEEEEVASTEEEEVASTEEEEVAPAEEEEVASTEEEEAAPAEEEAVAPTEEEEVASTEEEEAPPAAEERLPIEGDVIIERIMPESGIIFAGDSFTLKATVVGLADVDYEIQWQYDAGEGWMDVEGDSLELIVTVNEDLSNMNYDWRMVLTIAQSEPIEEAEQIAETEPVE